MFKRSQMREMSNEELKVIAQKKNKIGVATEEALYAQELIWSRRIHIADRS